MTPKRRNAVAYRDGQRSERGFQGGSGVGSLGFLAPAAPHVSKVFVGDFPPPVPPKFAPKPQVGPGSLPGVYGGVGRHVPRIVGAGLRMTPVVGWWINMGMLGYQILQPALWPNIDYGATAGVCDHLPVGHWLDGNFTIFCGNEQGHPNLTRPCSDDFQTWNFNPLTGGWRPRWNNASQGCVETIPYRPTIVIELPGIAMVPAVGFVPMADPMAVPIETPSPWPEPLPWAVAPYRQPNPYLVDDYAYAEPSAEPQPEPVTPPWVPPGNYNGPPGAPVKVLAGHPAKPPRKDQKERKVKVKNPAVAMALGIWGIVTEFNDWSKCAAASIPESAGRPGAGSIGRALHFLEHYEEADLGKLLACWVMSSKGDRQSAAFSRARARYVALKSGKDWWTLPAQVRNALEIAFGG